MPCPVMTTKVLGRGRRAVFNQSINHQIIAMYTGGQNITRESSVGKQVLGLGWISGRIPGRIPDIEIIRIPDIRLMSNAGYPADF